MPESETAELLKVIGNLQELIIKVNGWVAIGCSETALKAMKEAMENGWERTGWLAVLQSHGGG